MQDKNISPNFKLSEFNKRQKDSNLWVEPIPALLHVVQKIREKTGHAVTITDGVRSVEDHIALYKGIHGIGLWDHIKWTSRHLAQHGRPYLMAIDFKCSDGYSGYLTGEQINAHIQEIVKSPSFKDLFPDCYWGIGIGMHYVHLDTGDREVDAQWRYNY